MVAGAVKKLGMLAVLIAVSIVSLVQFNASGDMANIFSQTRGLVQAAGLLFAPIMLYVAWQVLKEAA